MLYKIWLCLALSGTVFSLIMAWVSLPYTSFTVPSKPCSSETAEPAHHTPWPHTRTTTTPNTELARKQHRASSPNKAASYHARLVACSRVHIWTSEQYERKRGGADACNRGCNAARLIGTCGRRAQERLSAQLSCRTLSAGCIAHTTILAIILVTFLPSHCLLLTGRWSLHAPLPLPRRLCCWSGCVSSFTKPQVELAPFCPTCRHNSMFQPCAPRTKCLYQMQYHTLLRLST